MTRIFGFLLILASCQSFASTQDAPEIPYEKQLIQRIQSQYEKISRNGRPLLYSNDTFRLTFTFNLVKIIELDELEQTLTSLIWTRHKWKDPFLTWNPREFGGIKFIRVPIKTIWRPDFILYNSVVDQSYDRGFDDSVAMAWISSDGTVIWIPPTVHKSHCTDVHDSSNFPYDKPKCSFKFGSWAYGANAFDPSFSDDISDISLASYQESRRWVLADHSAQKNTAYYSCCPNPFLDLTYSLTLTRGNIDYYWNILICPTILLCLLVVAPFVTATNSKSKVIIAAVVFVGFLIYGRIIDNAVSLVSKAGSPNIAKCFHTGTVLSAVSLLLSAFVRDIYECSHPAPGIVKKIFTDILSPIFFCTFFARFTSKKSKCQSSKPADSNVGEVEAEKQPLDNGDDGAAVELAEVAGEDEAQLSNISVREPSCCLSKLTDWQIVAMVVNRLCFILFSVAVALTLCCYLPVCE